MQNRSVVIVMEKMASPRCISLGFLVLMCFGLSSAHRVLLDSMATEVHKPKSGGNGDTAAAAGGTLDGSTGGMGRGQDSEPMTEPTHNKQDGEVKISPTEKEKQDSELMTKPTHNKQDGEVKIRPTEKEKQDDEPMIEPTHNKQDNDVKITPTEKEKQDDEPMIEPTHNKQNRDQMFKITNDKEKQDNETRSIDDKKHRSNNEVINNEPMPPDSVVDMQEHDEVIHSEPMVPDSVELES